MSPFLIVRGALTPLLALLALGHSTGAVPVQPSPVGFWTTVSDDDGRPTAVVEISERDGELFGVVRALLVPATHDDSLCGRCSGARRNQQIVGLEILSHMRPHGSEWSGGEVLDPESGRSYRATMHLADDGRRLVVRGYIGRPLFGRSQSWYRRAAPATDRAARRPLREPGLPAASASQPGGIRPGQGV
ncbi:MAG TPA: DUF2147 domain-containing protein [Gemmatimonadaceae bacterium]|nr:DUF2147 domain-containing protein [Gemmatimonadaceae bacterium]